MKKIKRWYQKNQLLSLILFLFSFSILFVAFFCTYITFKNSEKKFVHTHNETTQLLLKKMETDYEKLNDSIVNRFIEIEKNNYVYDYLTYAGTDPVHQSSTIYNIAASLSTNKLLYDKTPSNLVIIGKNQRLYSQNGSNPVYDTSELMNKKYIQEAKKAPLKLNYLITDKGYSSFTENQRQLIISKALVDKRQEIYGFAIMTIEEDDFSKFYDNLLKREIDQLWIYDHQGYIIATNQLSDFSKKIDLKKMRQDSKDSSTIHELKLNSFNYDILLKTNNRLVANELLLFPTIIFSLILVVLIAILLGYLVIKKTMNPLYELSHNMNQIAGGNFSTKITPHGTYDIQALQISYNKMVEDLHRYIDTLVYQEKDKRRLEFETLQLQIQPHFIYNTLTAIKFQVMKQQNHKAIESIEAFIRLLRYTIGQTKELITLEEELAILKDYIQILKMRYGENIQVNIYNMVEEKRVTVPKLLLQPIVENAFIHAFPNSAIGRIDILADLSENILMIEIVDDGTGLTDHRIDEQNSFSGIGLANIKERLALMYGDQATLTIESVPNQGTSVRIQIIDPKNYVQLLKE